VPGGKQVCALVLQCPLAQSPSAAHSTQVAAGSSQTGVALRCVHCVSAVQPAQTWAAVQREAAGVVQSVWALHATQAWALSSQTAVAPVQAAASLAVHWTQPPLEAQAGVAAKRVQLDPSTQPPQLWALVSHTGALAFVQSVSALHATQACVETSQAGVGSVQSVSMRHATHSWAVVSHTWSVQSVSIRHATQVPDASSHTGVVPVHMPPHGPASTAVSVPVSVALSRGPVSVALSIVSLSIVALSVAESTPASQRSGCSMQRSTM